MTTVMGFVRGGDHLLVSAACYGALKTFAEKWLAGMNVNVEFYPPAASAAEIEATDQAQHPHDLHGIARHGHDGNAGHASHHAKVARKARCPDHDG
jgi:hypothetical protein